MQALFLADKLQFVHDRPQPAPGPGEALVRVLLAGICGTDLELLRGYHGFRGVPGHEFVGIVEECADASWLGKRVVASINIGSGSDPRHAPDRTVLGILNRDGAFADYLTVPLQNLHEVPESVTDAAAVFCEPLAAAARMTERVKLTETDRIAVLGPGRLGLLCAEVLRLLGHAQTVLGHRAESLALPEELGYLTDLSAYLEDNSFDVVVDCTGSPDGLAEAIRLARPLGRIAMKSTFTDPAPVATSAIVVKELTVIGSRCGSMDVALGLLAHERLNYARMIAAEYPLHEGPRAFAHAAEPGAMKVLLNPWHPDRKPAPKGEAPRLGE